jgi:PTH1 family peptidyl-tRNA hydrolase
LETRVKLLVGLGNPGAKYARNRHNVGFMAVEAIAQAHGACSWRSKFQGALTEARIGSDRALILKPETFMNLSGDAVQAAVRFHKLAPGDVIVFHDELDLPPGKVRVKTGGGHGGHNGLRSIAARLGPDFARVRLGIGHPGDKRLVTPHVLGDFAKADAEWLDPLLARLAEAAPALVAGDSTGFLNALQAPKPPRAPKPAPADAAPTPEDTRGPLAKLVDRFR